MDLINKLLSLNFICLDDDKEERENWENGGAICQADFLAEKIGGKGFISFKTRELQLKHLETGDYNDFHLCAHYLMIDYLVCYVALNAELVSLEFIIEETLRCGDNKDLINELYSLNQINQAA